jgi:hypothetical protein
MMFLPFPFCQVGSPGRQEVLRAVSPALQEVAPAARKLQVAPAGVPQQPLRAEVPPALVAGADGEAAGGAVKGRRPPCIRFPAHGDVRPGAERGAVLPGAFLVRHEVDAPPAAARGARLSGIPVRRVVAGNGDAAAALRKGHLQPVVAERMRVGGFARHRTVEGERHPVPFPKLTGDCRAGRCGALGRECCRATALPDLVEDGSGPGLARQYDDALPGRRDEKGGQGEDRESEEYRSDHACLSHNHWCSSTTSPSASR